MFAGFADIHTGRDNISIEPLVNELKRGQSTKMITVLIIKYNNSIHFHKLLFVLLFNIHQVGASQKQITAVNITEQNILHNRRMIVIGG